MVADPDHASEEDNRFSIADVHGDAHADEMTHAIEPAAAAEQDNPVLGSLSPQEGRDAVADGESHPLDPRYVTLRRQTGLFGWIVTSAVLYVALIVLIGVLNVDDTTTLLLRIGYWTITVARGWLAFSWPAISYRHASYRVDENGVEARRGVITRSVVSVPRSRVQHTDVTQGPLERRHGLATLSIHTAGRQHELVMIFGLPHAQAVAIRDFLLPRENADAV